MTWRAPRSVPWVTPYPLPRDTAQALMDCKGECQNLGLLMDRYLAYGVSRRGPEFVREFSDRRALVPDFAPLADLVAAYRGRWEQTARALGAVTFTASPEWRVIVGLGTHALLEGGITLHRIYGLPYIPATALKGVCRLYAEAVLEVPEDESVHLFGEQVQRGDLIFLDAIPTAPPRMERDVMNPHMALYYGGRENVPPADYLSPRPVFFLTVGRGSIFCFGVASSSGDEAAAQKATDWLKRALQDIGVGAKTAAGYGYWVLET